MFNLFLHNLNRLTKNYDWVYFYTIYNLNLLRKTMNTFTTKIKLIYNDLYQEELPKVEAKKPKN